MATFRIRDPKTGKIVATVSGDGTEEEALAHFEASQGIKPPPSGAPVGPKVGSRPDGSGGYQPHDRGYPGKPEQYRATPDYDWQDYAGGFGKGAAIGGAMGLPFGGPAGGLTGAAAGGVGEVASMGLNQMGFGGGTQMGGSMLADAGMSMVSRRHAAKMAMKIPGVRGFTEDAIEYLGKGEAWDSVGGAVKRFLGRNWAAESTGMAQRQAGKLVSDLPSPPPAGTNPVVDVGEQVRSGHQMMNDTYQGARRQAEKETMGMRGRAEPVIRKSEELLDRFTHMDDTPKVLSDGAALPSEIGLHEAENFRGAAGQYDELHGPYDQVLDDLTSTADEYGPAAESVRKMRGAREAVEQSAPESSGTYQYLIGKGRSDNASKALERILSSDMSVTEVKRIRSLMNSVGDDIALRRAAVIHILQRRLGEQAASVAGSPQVGELMSLGGRSSSESAALTEILGERGFGHLEDLITASKAGKQGGKTGAIASRMLLYLAGASYGSTLSPTATTAVLALGGVVEAFMRQNGKQGVAKLAVAALLDADIYRAVTMGAAVNNAEAAAVRLGQTLVRRGLFTEDELGGD